MKKKLIIAITLLIALTVLVSLSNRLCVVLSSFAQESINTDSLFCLIKEVKVDSTEQARLDSICEKRGHVLNYGWITLVGWTPYYIDLPDRTLLISYDPNTMRGQCMRCKMYISQPVQTKPDTIIIWKK